MPTPQPKVDVSSLEKRVTELQKNLAFVGQGGSTQTSDLFTIIHRPGWTTIAQVELASNILDAMNQQASVIHGLRNVLDSHVKGSTGPL